MDFKVLVADPIAAEGIEFLRRHLEVEVRTGMPVEQLIETVPSYDALIVRSETKVTPPVIEAGARLQVVARAGVGVDNIDVDTATKRGVLVINAPLGNTVAAAEHAMALMLSLARRIPPADASIRAGEWKRSRFMGVELQHKTLGIVGLGKVGAEVARRARSFGMNLLAYDPYVSAAAAEALGVRLVPLDELMSHADVITVHAPLTPANRNLISTQELELAKPGLLLVNAARGGVVDEEAVAQALESGRMGGAAFDVFTREPITEDNPLLTAPQTVLTPHLGASTREAQVKVALEVAEQVVDVLNGRPARGAVNAPALPADLLADLGPYLELADRLGRLFTQVEGQSLGRLQVTYSGELASHDTRALRRALLRGLLEPITNERVSVVNAELIAQERGITLTEGTGIAPEGYTSTILLEGPEGAVEGTAIGDELRIIRFNSYPVDFVPNGHFLFCPHVDRPGFIGAVGTILGANNINISAAMSGRLAPRGETLLVLTLDEPVPDDVCEQLQTGVQGLRGLIRAEL
ncbi:MAG: phosphoglycerate dehydrogenase [Chloroflexota bacterium]|nr:phosphoglycerate dehydrogenase [Chloroflexota bacterium]